MNLRSVIAAGAALVAVGSAAYVGYRVKSGKAKVTVKVTDEKPTVEEAIASAPGGLSEVLGCIHAATQNATGRVNTPLVPTPETTDDVTEQLAQTLRQKELAIVKEHIEFLEVTSPRLFRDVKAVVTEEGVELIHANGEIQVHLPLASVIDLNQIDEALKRLNSEA